ncbi:MAG: hypothetical protein WCB96_11925 [Candidatus Aminicenantales bacterium]
MKSRKSILLAIFLCMIVYPQKNNSQVTNLSEDNGVDWLDHSDLFKVGFIEGVIMGAASANNELSDFGDLEYWDKSKTHDNYILSKIQSIKNKLAALSLFGISVGQIKEGVDVLYKDFSNRRIKIIDAIYIVKMQIKGESQEIIDAQVRYLKMLPIGSDVKDKAAEKLAKYMSENKYKFPTYSEIKSGDFSSEDLLRVGAIVTSDNNIHFLFRYGNYK